MARRLRLFSPPDCQPQLSREQRRAWGVYYTPPEIVQQIVDLALGPLLRSGSAIPRILDPACGAGEFLLEALRRLADCHGREAVLDSIHGIDIDSSAVATARRRLKAICPGFITANVRVGDALDPKLFPHTSFDAVVGNPPYVNIRQLAKSLPRAKIAALRDRFSTARGNFDLYVLFIERALELLRPGGRCGLIIPNKWATLDYARPCRELLLSQTTIEHVIDLSQERAFARASVYPHVLIFRKALSHTSHAIQLRNFPLDVPRRIPQRSLSGSALRLATALDVESHVLTHPLGEVAALSCGTAGYAAQKIALRLIDGKQTTAVGQDGALDFITSGNIDRYAIRLGNVRYLNRDYLQPRLPLDIPELTSAKRRLFSEPKIVIAGMSRRLEAAWDARSLALGVQVYAASDFRVDPFYLLALLNSKLLSYLFATRYAAKRLGSGYLAINKGQLARLPIRIINGADRHDRRLHDRLAELAASWHAFHESEADDLIYQVYRLTAAEIARIESHFSAPLSRAA